MKKNRTNFVSSFIIALLVCVLPGSASAQEEIDQTAPPSDGETIVHIDTSFGLMKIRLFPDQVPVTVENFTKLINDDFYTGLNFHRVIPGFMVQTGDPLSVDDDPLNDGTGGPGYEFEDEFSDSLKNLPGALSMANSGPHTNGSQFFINQVANTHLDGLHTVFGQVYAGFDVIDAITSVATDDRDRPLEDVRIERISLETAGAAEDQSVSTSDTEIKTRWTPRVIWKLIIKILLWVVGIIAVIVIFGAFFARRSAARKGAAFTTPKTHRKKRSKTFGKNKKRR